MNLQVLTLLGPPQEPAFSVRVLAETKRILSIIDCTEQTEILMIRKVGYLFVTV